MNRQGKGKIDWCNYTWNPVSGCKHGCSYCYMKRLSDRKLFDMTPKFHKKRLNEPDKIKEPSKIFVCSSADLFGNWVPREWIKKVLGTVKKCPQHTFQFLTKNPKRYGQFDFPDNCWLGTTVDGGDKTIHNANEMVGELTFNGSCPPKNITFISFEPLLCNAWEKMEPINGLMMLDHIKWIIIGANSNVGADKAEQEWADKLVSVAHNQGVAVWIKDNYGYSKTIKEFPDGGVK